MYRLERHFLAAISTAHLSPAAKAYLDRGCDLSSTPYVQMVEEHPDTDDSVRLLVPFYGDHFFVEGGGNSIWSIPHRTGWLVFAHDEFSGDDADEVPPDLAEIILAANADGCTWINFDVDATPTYGLPTFDKELKMPDTIQATGPDRKPKAVKLAPRVRKVCAECGGAAVFADAYVAWNEELQQWEIVNCFDKGSHCDDCEGECRIEDEPIEDRRYRATLTVNVLCTAEITVEVQASSIAQARDRAEGMARNSDEARWTFDEGKDFDWGSMDTVSVEAVEGEQEP